MTFDFDPLFRPESVAVVGASDNPGKLGFHVMKSLVDGGYPGRLLPVNPRKRRILGHDAHPSLEAVPGDVDLAIVVLPATMVPAIIQSCARKGVRGIVLITAGFKEIDDASGAELQAEVAEAANQSGIPIIGPNTFGIVNLHLPLNASFTPEFSRLSPGSVALLSQSGGMAHLIGNLAMRANLGFSKVVGLGNRCNVDFAEMLQWLADDPQTEVIAMYMEGIEDPLRFLEVAGRTHRRKPLIIYKVGRSEVADLASASHTGSLAGRHELYQAGFRQKGIISVDSAEALLDGAKALAQSPLPRGPKVAVLTGQAGLAMAACDTCEKHGLRLATFSHRCQQEINDRLPPLALRTNPVDMGPAWYDSPAIRGIVQAVQDDQEVDGILFYMVFASANANALKGIADILMAWGQRKPLLACISAPFGVWDREIKRLEDSGALVNFPSPERAARAMAILNQRRLILNQPRESDVENAIGGRRSFG